MPTIGLGRMPKNQFRLHAKIQLGLESKNANESEHTNYIWQFQQNSKWLQKCNIADKTENCSEFS